MQDDELHARFAGLRIAIAFAIKAASRTPLDLSHHIAELRQIESQFPPGTHPGATEEFDGIIKALLRMPVRDPGHGHPTQGSAVPTAIDREVAPRDLLG